MKSSTKSSSSITIKNGLRRDQNCDRCPLHENAKSVCLLGSGPSPCDVGIIGEAPGEREDDESKVFVGRAGQYLHDVLEAVGFKREEVFITNAVSCRPPGNRTPKKREIDACNHWLQYQLSKVRPKYILLLGNVALQAVTGEKGIKAARGKPFKKAGVLYLPAYHPSYILRNDYKDDEIFKNDLRLFKSLVEGGDLPREKRLSIKTITDEASFKAMLANLAGDVSFDIETTGLYPWAKENRTALPKKWKKDPPDPRSYTAEVKSIGFGTAKHQWVWLKGSFEYTPDRLHRAGDKLQECVVSGHYAKFDALWMKVRHGVEWHVDFDTGLAHYMLDENSSHGLKDLAQRLCNAPNWDVDKKTKQFGNDTPEQSIRYHAHDLFYTRELHQKFKRELREDPGVHRVFHHIMMPCNRAFVDMEFEGPYVDMSLMDEVETELKNRIHHGHKNLRKWVPTSKRDEFNWGSPKQVGWLLYTKLKIKCPEVTKTGAQSTAESALKQIDHPLIDDLFKLREAKQQLSFFIDGWKPYLIGNRLHPAFKLTGTVTGRLACENPNLQQVPRDPLIRRLITAPKGWVLIEADLSQVELRIAAELSGDIALIQAFVEGKDPHWITALRELQRGHGEAQRIIKTARKLRKNTNDYDEAIEFLIEKGADACIEADYAWKELRKKAKAVNFGYLYGMWWKKFIIYARDKYGVKITPEQAQESRKAFFGNWRQLEGWHKRTKNFARRNGYVRYLSGRKRRLPDALLGEDNFKRQEAERQAVNSPVQGMANEINLMALIQLKKEFSSKVYRPIATVHDSILAYARIDHAEKISRRTMKVMKRPNLMDKFDIDLRVPIEADVKIGAWGAGVSLDKWLKEHGSNKTKRLEKEILPRRKKAA